MKFLPALLLMLVVLAPGFGAAEASGAEAEAALIAHWKMDEGSGTTIGDSSGNGYDGTASGGSWSTDVPPAAGAGSYSYQFNGVSSFIDTAVFDINDDFSIAVWVKPADTEAEAILGKHTDAAANQLLFGIYDGDYILNIHDDVQRTYPVRQGEWQHLLLVGQATGSKTAVTVYRNGIPLMTFHHDQVTGDLSGGKPWTIGRDWDPSEANDYFEGLMADLRIYDDALSDAEIAALTEGFAETCTTPSGNYPYLHLALMNTGCDIIEV
ncbi:MAG: LamG domain-containing protein, partial [Candidatus Promineifilaceae bacterium]